MKVEYITKMIVLLSFLFLNKISIFSQINNYVKVKYENITLYNLAPDYVEREKGEKIILGKIKIPGGKYIVKGNQIKAELKNIGVQLKNVPDSITVERDYVELSTAQIENELLSALKLKNTDFDYSIYILSRDTLRMPVGNIEFRIEESKGNNLGKNQGIAGVYEDNKKVYEFPFSLNSGKIIKEYTLIKDVKKGENYSQDKVSVKSELVFEETRLRSLELNEKSIFTEDLLAGTKLQSNHVEDGGTVRKGQKISIELVFGNLSIFDKGEALQNGEIGQQIEVKNIRTGKFLKALIKDENTVKIIGNE